MWEEIAPIFNVVAGSIVTGMLAAVVLDLIGLFDDKQKEDKQ